MDKPIVSILISCYNHEKFVEKAIDSVMSQTFSNIELLITDDGSTDNSRDVIERTLLKYENDPRIHYFPNVVNTAFRSYEALQTQIKGKYFACLGSDDIWEPDKLQTQVDFLENHPEYKACFTWVNVLSDSPDCKKENETFFNINNRSQIDWIRLFVLEGNRMCAPSLLMCSDVWRELGGFDFSYRNLQDYDLWLRFVVKYQFYILQEKLTNYRKHDGNLSNNRDKGAISCNSVEMQYVHLNFMELIPSELFMKSFYPGVELDTNAEDYELEVCCRKFLMYINLEPLHANNAAISFWFRHRKDEGFLDKLENDFNYSRSDMYRHRANDSANRKLIDLFMENASLRDMMAAGRIHIETLDRSDEDLVEELLNFIDGKYVNKDEAWNKILEDHIIALFRMCKKMPDGDRNFVEVIQAMYQKKNGD